MDQFLIGMFVFGILFSTIFFNYKVFRRNYYFYKSYLSEINEFIHNEKLVLIEVRNPVPEDWKDNPFGTRNSFFPEMALPFSLLVHYTFIVKDSDNNLKQFWLRNRSSFFGKNETRFREAKPERFILESGVEISRNIEADPNIIEVLSECPACKAKVTAENKECPDCGLKFL
ncbi:hypothetical protein GWK08_05445 [Leptobacterium flavescens]|uniref:Uncharacterized protein n=1 Tax=Leptobacterium flavescens TaxID=472055 RepID=A0A6P0UI02_9FLAO|nr:zinc ribbon domain-containing protein [Leptobacterium flavescens]NER12874.1 hypothetical protein [Leptobacterium flavescens]